MASITGDKTGGFVLVICYPVCSILVLETTAPCAAVPPISTTTTRLSRLIILTRRLAWTGFDHHPAAIGNGEIPVDRTGLFYLSSRVG